jgi:nucleotide-binding universal stress UspA family protein
MSKQVDDIIKHDTKYPHIKKILVPIDRTLLSIKAARYGIHLAQIENAELLIMINVIEDIKQGGAIGLQAKYGNANLVRDFEDFKKESATGVMKSIIEEEKVEGEKGRVNIKSEILYAHGKSTAKVIAEYAHRNEIDIIVMGGTKLAKWKYLLIGGSVSAGIINKAKCHVLLIR